VTRIKNAIAINASATNAAGSNAVIAMLAIFAAVLLCASFSLYQEASKALQAKQWPTVQGTVISSRVAHRCRGGNFLVSIHYAYKVEGRSYTNDKFVFGPTCLPENEARAMVDQFPVGDVKVWFNPQNPEIAALMVGSVLDRTWSSIYTTSCVAIFLLIVAGYLYRSTRLK